MLDDGADGGKRRPPGIELAAHDTLDGCSDAGLVSAIRMADLSGIDLMFISEKKVAGNIHTKNGLGCNVSLLVAVATAGGDAKWGAGVIVRDGPKGWHLESSCFHGPSVVSFEVATGNKRTPVIGAHLPPLTLDHLGDLEEAFNRFLGKDVVPLGDLNANIHDLSKPRNQEASNFLAPFGLLDLLLHFRSPP